jgi:ankyrin repeat protein
VPIFNLLKIEIMRNFQSNPVCLFLFLLLLFLIGNGCDNPPPEETDAQAPPALLIAAERGDLPTLTKLIGRNDVTIDVKDACFWTPLMKAALNGHTEAVERLILAGADVNQLDKGGYSSLMLAASNNHAEIIVLLIDAGANIDQIELTKGWTALIWAAKQGHREAVEQLLRYPLDREIRDFSGKHALDWARENKFHEIVSLLLNPTDSSGRL